MTNNKSVSDKIFDGILDIVAPIAEERIGAKIPEPTEEIIFSKEHQRKMQKLFAAERNKIRRKTALKYTIRIAAVFLILITIATVAIASVEAWRVRFRNFIIDLRADHTVIDFRDDFAEDTFEIYDFYFGYMPDGFEFVRSMSLDNFLMVEFRNEDLNFRVSIRDIDAGLAIDTEDADIQRITINGHQAFFSTNDNINILVWHDNEYSYRLEGNIEKNQIILIAENIQ